MAAKISGRKKDEGERAQGAMHPGWMHRLITQLPIRLDSECEMDKSTVKRVRNLCPHESRRPVNLWRG
jgi:hypothetical protein